MKQINQESITDFIEFSNASQPEFIKIPEHLVTLYNQTISLISGEEALLEENEDVIDNNKLIGTHIREAYHLLKNWKLSK